MKNRKFALAAAVTVLLTYCGGAAAADPCSHDSHGLKSQFFAMDTATGGAQLPAAEQVALAKELGYAGIGYWQRNAIGIAGTVEMLEELDKAGLGVFPIYTAVDFEQPNSPDLSLLEQTIDLLAKRGGGIVWVSVRLPASRKYKPSSEAFDDQLVNALTQLAQRGETQGVKLALYPHADSLLEKVEDALRVVKKVNRPSVGLTFNVCHWLKVQGSGDLDKTLDEAIPYLFVVTINGADKDGSNWDALIQTLDKGTFDNYSLLKGLYLRGYVGPIGLQGFGIKGDVRENLAASMKAYKDMTAKLAMEEETICRRGLVNMGDTSRIKKVMAKAQRGEKIVIGVIGGSITQGDAATAAYHRWANVVLQWWRDNFPQAEFTLTNAGIGATDSYYGSHRAYKHLLQYKPDFVVAEYSVNEDNTQFCGETLEGLIRQVLKSDNDPAMMVLCMYNRAGKSAQEWHAKVAAHYGLPTVSFRDAYVPEIEAGRLTWDGILGDPVHPNNFGHTLIALLITSVLDEIKASTQKPDFTPLPMPLISDRFEHAALLLPDDIEPKRNIGWQVFDRQEPMKFRRLLGKGWRTEEAGSVLEFEVQGSVIGVMYEAAKKDMATVEVQVDDMQPVKLDAWMEENWGGSVFAKRIAEGIDPGPHKLKITVLEETNPNSGGHIFELRALLAAGYMEKKELAREDVSSDMLQRSVVSIGDTARLQKTLAKARRGEKVVIAAIGGSITQGAAATRAEYRYPNRVAKWWKDTFPQAQVEFINAGIGATGSYIGAHRVREHLLRNKPDFVISEYSVNDPNTELSAETLEGMLRQILKSDNAPAVMLLFMVNKDDQTAQGWHSKVGLHYGLPMVSFRDAFRPELKSGNVNWEDIEADVVHPNDRGHEYAAQFITSMLQDVLSSLPPDDALPDAKPVPAPLISDVFEYTDILNFDDVEPAGNEGWEKLDKTPFGPGWRATEPGSILELDVEASALSVVFYRIRGNMGMAAAQIDDRPPVKMDGWFSETWGGYSHQTLIARDLAPGKHRLRIELLDEKADASTAHKFDIAGIFLAGIPK